MELFFIYLWLKLDTLIGMSSFAAGVCLLISAITFVIMKSEGDAVPNFVKPLFIFGLCATIFAAFLPSKTDMAVLVGSHYALQAAESPEGQKVFSLLRKKANEILDEQLATPEKK